VAGFEINHGGEPRDLFLPAGWAVSRLEGRSTSYGWCVSL
jgi:hypothetical protein